jgi:Flp pilus assembly protein TadG
MEGVMKRDTGHFLQSLRGNVAIEFAFVLPVILLLFSGIVNFGLILSNKNQLNGVVSAGMLFAFGNSSVPATVQAAMLASTSNLSPLTTTATTFCRCLSGSTPLCTATCPDGASPAKYVSVTASSQVSLIPLTLVLTNPFPTTASGTIRTTR